MGICQSCLEGTSADNNQPTPETRRRQMAEAAEKRKRDDEGRGLKDPEGVKRKQQRKEEIEKQVELQGGGEPTMKWQVS